MNPDPKAPEHEDGLRAEYDFTTGVRGAHHHAYLAGTNVVLLDPDVAAVFHDSVAVNDALRMLVRIAMEQVHPSRSA
jgi:3-dehydroquinate dehydratase